MREREKLGSPIVPNFVPTTKPYCVLQVSFLTSCGGGTPQVSDSNDTTCNFVRTLRNLRVTLSP